MTEELTTLAADLYSMELPAPPRAPETRKKLFGRITETYPEAEFAGQGDGRIVVWAPTPPHRPLTETEQSQTHDGVVIKFAYNEEHGRGRQQNRTEALIWEHGSPVIDDEDLTPVFGEGEDDRWVIMPYRDLIRKASRFEETMIEKFGELPPGDLCAKDSWGLAGDGSIECCDYGRCPTHCSGNQTTGGETDANVTV